MTNLRQAAQQALDEILRVNSAGIFEGELNEAIAALRAALSEPERKERVMDRELIVQLAQEAIFDFPNEDPFDFTLKTLQQRERFAELVANEERKRICDMLRDRHAKEERHNYYLFIANLIKESP